MNTARETDDESLPEEKEKNTLIGILQEVMTQFWHQIAQDTGFTGLELLMHQIARGNYRLRFPASAKEQTTQCQKVAVKVLNETFNEPMLRPESDFSGAERLAYQIYQALTESAATLNFEPPNPFGALAEASAGYFVPFQPPLAYLQIHQPVFWQKVANLEGAERTAKEKRIIFNLLYSAIQFMGVGLFQISPAQPLIVDFEKSEVRLEKGGKILIRENPFVLSPLLIAHKQTISAAYVVLTYGICAALLISNHKEVKRIYEAGVGSWRHLTYMATMFQEAQFFGCDPFPSFCQPSEGVTRFEKDTGIDIQSRANIVPGDFARGLSETNFTAHGPYELIYVTFMLPEDFAISPVIDCLTNEGMFIAPIAEKGMGEGNGWLWVFYKVEGEVAKLPLVRCSFQPAQRGIQ